MLGSPSLNPFPKQLRKRFYFVFREKRLYFFTNCVAGVIAGEVFQRDLFEIGQVTVAKLMESVHLKPLPANRRVRAQPLAIRQVLFQHVVVRLPIEVLSKVFRILRRVVAQKIDHRTLAITIQGKW